jgi:UDP-N-acetylmuramoylalanine--D-glutamate ligase
MLSLEQCSKKKFLVFGLGVSGHATLSQLKKNKANIECWDDSKQLREKFKNKYRVNKNWFKSSYDFIVISPGINIYSHSKKVIFFIKIKTKLLLIWIYFVVLLKIKKLLW